MNIALLFLTTYTCNKAIATHMNGIDCDAIDFYESTTTNTSLTEYLRNQDYFLLFNLVFTCYFAYLYFINGNNSAFPGSTIYSTEISRISCQVRNDIY
jgi:hypothetical protein